MERRAKDKVQVLKGRIKEGIGRATGIRQLKREGKTDRVAGNLKQSGEKAKDAVTTTARVAWSRVH